jgi:hypothetical protein
MGIKVDVYGVRETLAELRKYERVTFNRISSDLKTSAKPAANAVGRAFPDEPLLNWHTSGGRLSSKSRLPPYNGASAKSKVRVAISTKKPTGIGQHGLIRIQQMDAGGQVYDWAGSVTAGRQGSMATAGQKFVSNLDKHLRTKSKGGGKSRSRIMYPFTEKNLPLIEKAIEISIRKIDGEVQKRLNG